MGFGVNALTPKSRSLGSLTWHTYLKNPEGMYMGRTLLLQPFPSVHVLPSSNLHSRDISV
jgi:hypothetical protein